MKGGGDFSLMVMKSTKNDCLTLYMKVLQSLTMTGNYSSNDMAVQPETLASSGPLLLLIFPHTSNTTNEWYMITWVPIHIKEAVLVF